MGAPRLLLGRDEQLARLRAALHDLTRGVGTTWLVEGEAGSGKSSLLRAFATSPEAEHVRLLRGEYGAAVDVPLGPLLVALGRRPDAPGGFPAVEQVGDGVEALALAAPVVLLVDDLQDADPATLSALPALVARWAALPVLVVAALRPGRTAAVSRCTERLLRTGAHHVTLGPLADGDVATLAQAIAGVPPGPSLAVLLARTGGNPLYVEALLTGLLDEGRVDCTSGRAEVVAAGVPQDLRQLVLRRLAQVSPATAALLRAAAVLGTSFALPDLATTVGRPATDLLVELAEAQAEGLVVDDVDRLAFRHALVRDAVYEDLPVAVRRELHRGAARALAEAGAPARAVAAQFAAGATRGDDEAVRWLRRAATESLAGDPVAAARLLEQARHLVPAGAASRWPVLAELTEALAWSGQLPAAVSLGEQVLAQVPPPEVALQVRSTLVHAQTWQGRPHDARRFAAVETAAPFLLAQEAVALALGGDPRGAGAAADAALGVAEDDLTRCCALCARSWSRLFQGFWQDAVSDATAAVSLAEAAGPDGLRAQPWFFLSLALLVADRVDEAEHVAQRGRALMEDAGLTWTLPLYHSYVANAHFVRGSWDDAMTLDEAARALGEEYGLHLSVVTASASRVARIAVARGELAAAERALGDAEAWMRAQGRQVGGALLDSARALVLEARGQVPEAAALLASTWQRNLDAGIVSEVRLLAPDLVRLLLAAGDRPAAEAVLPQVDRIAGHMQLPSVTGAALRCAGRVTGDPSTHVAAVQAYAASPRVLERASAGHEAALALARAGDADAARPLLEQSAEVYSRLGATALLDRLAADARDAGLRVPARRRRARATTGWESLTDTEAKVVALVAEGLTNRQVADRLFLSRHTVDFHLRHVFGKLGMSSRVELASAAALRRP